MTLVMAGLTIMADDQGPMSVPRPNPIGYGVADYGSYTPVLPATPTVAAATVSTHFKMIFLAVFFLTVGLLVVRVTVGIVVQEPSESLRDAMTTCSLLGNAGFGAMLGLIGGKIS